MDLVRLDSGAVDGELAAVARRMSERLDEVARDVRTAIADALPALADDEPGAALLFASVQENVNTVLHGFQHGMPSVVAPNAAVAYARRVAQRDLGSTSLLRAYRVGLARFQERCIEELTRGRDGDHVEANSARRIVNVTSAYVDTILEQLDDIYQRARDEVLSHRSAILIQHVRTLLHADDVGVDEAQRMLGAYRLGRNHLGAIVWCDRSMPICNVLDELQRYAQRLGKTVGAVEPPLFIPYDDTTAWLWLPLREGQSVERARLENAGEVDIFVATGDPLYGFPGFRRSHRQARLACAVVSAAKPPLSRLTTFAEVASIAAFTSDLDGARAWVAETLAGLAVDDERGSMLRETARVFLANGGSFAATAHEMNLHRNTVQYRIGKAEELRGRPFSDGRLDVEIALLACRYFGGAVLRPGDEHAERSGFGPPA
ncbi:MAG TPA: helix-turn-helix domain-containing protein [Candidatus Limnocylindrales bacterium]|nr:helix-turn-helix domain-containing protein [Candidatus Limnocylindrales bacterium]